MKDQNSEMSNIKSAHNSKKIEETAKSAKYVVDRVNKQTRPDRIEPEVKNLEPTISPIVKSKRRQKKKYDPRSGNRGRRNMRRQAAGRHEGKYDAAVKIITDCVGKPMSLIIEDLSKIDSYYRLIIVLDKMMSDDVLREWCSSFKEAVYSLAEGKSDAVRSSAILNGENAEQQQQEALNVVTKAAQEMTKIYPSYVIWIERRELVKHNQVLFLARASFGDNGWQEFSESQDKGFVVERIQ